MGERVAQYNSFIVRVLSDDDGSFHGQIVHVATQEKRHFRNMERMIEFILEHLGRGDDRCDSSVLRTSSAKPMGMDDNDNDDDS